MINYAHRGASAYAPENTMAAFELGLDQEANGIETDVQRTSDGVLVLHHDKTLRRTAGLDERVRDLSWGQLQALDFGRWFDARFAGERMVTLEAFLARYAAMPVHLALELKQSGIEAQFLDAIAGLDPARLIITAFELDALKAVRRLNSGLPLGYLTERITPEVLAELKAWGIGQICPRMRSVDEAGMRLARNEGFSVRAWGVTDEMWMRHGLAHGVDGMTVNFPDRLTAALKEKAECKP